MKAFGQRLWIRFRDLNESERSFRDERGHEAQGDLTQSQIAKMTLKDHKWFKDS